MENVNPMVNNKKYPYELLLGSIIKKSNIVKNANKDIIIGIEFDRQ